VAAVAGVGAPPGLFLLRVGEGELLEESSLRCSGGGGECPAELWRLAERVVRVMNLRRRISDYLIIFHFTQMVF